MKRVALLGMPNVGKSTLFNRLTGASARVGNWPGLTVELAAARLPLGRHLAELVDLPGIYDLQGQGEDERVVRSFLGSQRVDLAVLVLGAPQADRQLGLAVQLRDAGLPCVLLLNMIDEADRDGVLIDRARLQRQLGMPVLAVSAKYGQGMAVALQQLGRALDSTVAQPVEAVAQTLRQPQAGAALAAADAIARDCVQLPARLPERWGRKLDHWLMHPLFGLPIFLLSMALLFNLVFTLGKPVQDACGQLFELVRGTLLEPALGRAPGWLHGLLLDGVWGGLSTVASFVPLILLFFAGMTLVEESGYLARAAYLVDRLMQKLGLDGRSFVMLLMGFGCNVPAMMGTRVMRSRPLRLLTMLIMPFSLCSARLQVFVFIIAAVFSARTAPWVLLSLYAWSLLATLASALLFKPVLRADEPFVLELPPYRMPSVRQLLWRAWGEIRHFLDRATRFIVLGAVAVWALTHLPAGTDVQHSVAAWLGHLFDPVFAPLGIPLPLVLALLFGFVAKEVVIGSLAVIYGLQSGALQQAIATQVTPLAAYSFMLFTLLYTPCLSTLATQRSESGSWLYTAGSLCWSLGLAWLVSAAFYQGALQLGWN